MPLTRREIQLLEQFIQEEQRSNTMPRTETFAEASLRLRREEEERARREERLERERRMFTGSLTIDANALNAASLTNPWNYTITNKMMVSENKPSPTIPNLKTVAEAAKYMQEALTAIFGDTAMLHSRNGYKLADAYKKLDAALALIAEKKEETKKVDTTEEIPF
jgi:hypothetical protein